ncbi:hypothetical protein NS383_17610 [Pseudomonas oryzihabitans]|nr:hypothetical protein NS383_17610 [Pseudomonas psychrotolerans]
MPIHVCVTGASGFLGSHIVTRLMDHDCHVTALFRRPTPHLEALATRHRQLTLRQVDLTQQQSCLQALNGCDRVIHCAASVSNDARPGSPQWQQTLTMNIEGTRNLIEGVRQTPGIDTLVHTSSMAAILSSSHPADHTYSEADWNLDPLEGNDPYWYSKTVAERLLVDAYWPAKAPRLVCINPSVIIGPVHDLRHAQTSIAILDDLYSGRTPACPDLNFHFVDVRDLAELHVRAVLDSHVEGRFVVPGREISMLALADSIRQRFPGCKAPHRRAPDWLMYLSALVSPRLSRRYLKQNLGVHRRFDDSRARHVFALDYRPLEQSIADTLLSLHPAAA